MIRLHSLSKNDIPKNAGGELSPVSPIMRRVLSPFRRRRSVDHQTPEKFKEKEAVVKDPHLGKTVEVSPMDDESEGPTINHQKSQVLEETPEVFLALQIPHKVKAKQNTQESSLARLTKSINSLLHRSDASSTGQVPAGSAPSKRCRVGRRRSFLGTIGEQRVSLTDHIIRPRRASMGDSPSMASSLSSLSSIGSVNASLATSTSRRCGPLDDLLTQEDEDDSDNQEELLGNSEHVLLPKSSFPTPRIITINKDDKHHTREETHSSVAMESRTNQSPATIKGISLGVPCAAVHTEDLGNSPTSLTHSPQSQSESSDSDLALSPSKGMSHVEPARVHQRQRRYATNQRLQRADCHTASPAASTSVLSPTKKRQTLAVELSKMEPPTSLAFLSPYSPRKKKTSCSSISLSQESKSSKRQTQPRSPRRRIVSSSGSTMRGVPLARAPSGQPKSSPMNPQVRNISASSLAAVPDLDGSDEMTKASAITTTTKKRTQKIKPRRRTSLASVGSGEQVPKPTKTKPQRQTPGRTVSLDELSRQIQNDGDSLLHKDSSQTSPTRNGRDRPKPSLASTSWGDPSFEPHKLESDTSFASPTTKSKTKVHKLVASSGSSTSRGEISCEESSPYGNRPDKNGMYESDSPSTTTSFVESPCQRRGEKAFASTAWGDLSFSALASPTKAQEISRAVLASLDAPTSPVSPPQPRQGRRPRTLNAPCQDDKEINVSVSSKPKAFMAPRCSPEEASTLLSPYHIATHTQNDESSSSSSEAAF